MTAEITAVRMTRIEHDNAPSAVEVVRLPAPEPREGMVAVDVRAASLNRHDLWSIQGVGVDPAHLPMILGSDAAGVTDDGRDVIVHSLAATVDNADGDELLDPRRAMLADAGMGVLSGRIVVPARNLVTKPEQLSFEEASCLPTAWLTAYHSLFVRARLVPGQTLLVQGVGGGVATAAIALAHAAGARVWATSRSPERARNALSLGADDVFASGERLPERVDLALESVGEATWDHTLRSLKPGGTVVVVGATTGSKVGLDLDSVFLRRLTILGSALGRVSELRALAQFCALHGVHPTIDSIHPFSDAAAAIERISAGDSFGKVVLVPDPR